MLELYNAKLEELSDKVQEDLIIFAETAWLTSTVLTDNELKKVLQEESNKIVKQETLLNLEHHFKNNPAIGEEEKEKEKSLKQVVNGYFDGLEAAQDRKFIKAKRQETRKQFAKNFFSKKTQQK